MLAGFALTGTGDAANTFRGNLGVMNASQFSTTTLTLRLFQGAFIADEPDPMRRIAGAIAVVALLSGLFPALGAARIDPAPTIAGRI